MDPKGTPKVRKSDLIDARAANLRANLQRRKAATSDQNTKKDKTK